MKKLIVKMGDEPLIRDAVAYLALRYGIPPDAILAIELAGHVGQPLTIKVTLFMEDEDEQG